MQDRVSVGQERLCRDRKTVQYRRHSIGTERKSIDNETVYRQRYSIGTVSLGFF